MGVVVDLNRDCGAGSFSPANAGTEDANPKIPTTPTKLPRAGQALACNWMWQPDPCFHVVLLRAGCAVRATLGFRCDYLNAWELYCGSAEGRKKVKAANSLRLKRLEGESGQPETSGTRAYELKFGARLGHLRRASVEQAVHSPRLVRFETFEVDVRAGELRKAGVRLKLPGQPFQVLAILLERPGEVVTREELQKRLWPDTFVDVDHNLNTAINKIREVLGDSAESPRFVETLPRRGYRFIAPVDVGAGLVPAQQGAPKGYPYRRSLMVEKRLANQSLQRHWVLGLSGAAIIVIAVLSYWLTRPLMPPKVSGYTRITNDGRAKKFRIDALPVIATDGLRLYFTEAANSGMRSTLNQASASGGETSPVPTPFEQNIELGDIASNRSDLLLHTFVAGESEMPLWILPALGGSPRRVGDVLGRDAAWSPDGDRIAYAKGHELYVCKADGTETRRLVTASGQVRWPRWSPRGSVLRFTVGDPGGCRLQLRRFQRSEVVPTLCSPAGRVIYCCGNWTPDGKYYVFQSIFTSDSRD